MCKPFEDSVLLSITVVIIVIIFAVNVIVVVAAAVDDGSVNGQYKQTNYQLTAINMIFFFF